jgi:hypothetical protein
MAIGKVALISQKVRGERGVVLLGVELRDAREEMFVMMVCDGLPLKLAYKRAGFESRNNNAPSKLFSLPRIQERAHKILEARRTTGVVTLSEVTDMLKRVYAGAHSAEEYNAAHNAAFSLARLYGHVTDKATLEVIRRPSRDPDAPSEQVLSDWVASLPVVSPDALGLELSAGALEGPHSRAPAAPLGPEPSARTDLLRDNITKLGSGLQLDLFNDINGLAMAEGRATIENGAPMGQVTGTPHRGARSGEHSKSLATEPLTTESLATEPLTTEPPPKKRVPRKPKEGTGPTRGKIQKKRKLPPRGQSVKKSRTKFPSAKDLFG